MTSDNIKIPEGKRVPVELRLSGYHTKKVVVAWNQGKISERLSKKVKETNEEEEGLKTPEAFKDKGGN